ncbi:hypothetical protein B0H21DRAFT_227184 [Amylocystis lapponica]|nr:hypothetical protein B0H21DRAFT_227184 [Amylocystis lapponica]
MTRGRRKDLTIPPSRALLQQRDYRARKARYVADLEDRCQHAEEENVRLREEVDVLRARLSAPNRDGPSGHRPSPSPEVATASTELMQHLTVAAASLARFQQLALSPEAFPRPHQQINPNTPVSLATPSFTPSPVSQPHPRLPSPRPLLEHSYAHRGEPSNYLRLPPLGRLLGPAQFTYPEPERVRPYDHRSFMDEDEDEDDEELDREHELRASRLTQRMSDLRSTTSSGSSQEEAGPSRTPNNPPISPQCNCSLALH